MSLDDLTNFLSAAAIDTATGVLAEKAETEVKNRIQNIAQTWTEWKCTPSNHGMECGICNIPFWTGDKVRDLKPGCVHVFHYECIYRYVQRKSKSCPTCKKSIILKIGVQYVDPLAQFFEN
jgi:hypothetical protein